jgi:segregation and condensation protein B
MNSQIKPRVEALIFASDKPVKAAQLIKMLATDDVSTEDIEKIVADLNSDYNQRNAAFFIQTLAGGYSFRTREAFDADIREMEGLNKQYQLSPKGLETLAIVAYRQPVTRVEIDAIRGVNSDYLIRQLLEKDLISILGRAQAPGQPLLYGTSERFLRFFGLESLDALPRLREIDELIKQDHSFLKKLNQFDLQQIDPNQLGLEFSEKMIELNQRLDDHQAEQNAQEEE